MDAPTEVSEAQLKELHIRVRVPPKGRVAVAVFSTPGVGPRRDLYCGWRVSVARAAQARGFLAIGPPAVSNGARPRMRPRAASSIEETGITQGLLRNLAMDAGVRDLAFVR